MSTEARGLQGQPAAGRRDGALSRQVVVPLLLVLAAAAGCLDAMAVSRLGGPFASVVTGNLIQLGRGLVIPNRHLVASTSTAVASYAVGVAIGTVVLRGSLPGWRLRTCVVTSVELLLLVGVLAGWVTTGGSPGTGQAIFLLALAAAAMGLQSAATLSTGVPEASTTYMTGTLTSFMRAVATDPHLIGGAAGAGIARLLSLLAGVLIGALILKFAPLWTPVFPVALIAGTVVLAAALGPWKSTKVRSGGKHHDEHTQP
jgi:uncharacterized membrane protein YoaK (UPF0700 family)